MLPTPELQIARDLPADGCTVEEAQRYTRWLATHHYENFSVVSWLLPRHLHQHFYNVYAYCRWSDVLGDEVGDPARAMKLLDAWEQELRGIYEPGGRVSHPVLIALAETIRVKEIPIKPFGDLLRAFRQDQTVQRYATWSDVLDYCVYSANPVGRLVLYLCGYRDEERQRLSDFTCTALQLANFWQDVSLDLDKGRIYIPQVALAAHELTERDIVARRFDERYAHMMKGLIAETRAMFHPGLPLARRVDKTLSIDIELFSRGGVAILDAIEVSGYNTLNRRPAITKGTKLKLLARALASRAFSRGGPTEGHRHDPVFERSCRFRRRGNQEPNRESEGYCKCCRVLCGVQPDCTNGAEQFLPCVLRLAKRKAQCTVRALCVHAAGGQCFG